MLLLNETYEQEMTIFDNVNGITLSDINQMPCIDFDVYYSKVLKSIEERLKNRNDNGSDRLEGMFK